MRNLTTAELALLEGVAERDYLTGNQLMIEQGQLAISMSGHYTLAELLNRCSALADWQRVLDHRIKAAAKAVAAK